MGYWCSCIWYWSSSTNISHFQTFDGATQNQFVYLYIKLARFELFNHYHCCLQSSIFICFFTITSLCKHSFTNNWTWSVSLKYLFLGEFMININDLWKYYWWFVFMIPDGDIKWVYFCTVRDFLNRWYYSILIPVFIMRWRQNSW